MRLKARLLCVSFNSLAKRSSHAALQTFRPELRTPQSARAFLCESIRKVGVFGDLICLFSGVKNTLLVKLPI